MVMIFTLAISSTTVQASGLPAYSWISYHRGGFDVFTHAAWGDHGLHNMARAMLSDQLHTQLHSAFNNSKLGSQRGDSINRNITISTTTNDFSSLNTNYRLGYVNHRNWRNVWRYQSNGNLGAGRHDQFENMAWFRPFADVTLTTNDGSINATIRYISFTTLNVRLTRVKESSTNPVFTGHSQVLLPIQMFFNRWNRLGTRVNDYNATDVLAIVEWGAKGPLGVWNLSPYLQ
jgi:hypothetical protein